MDPEGHLPRELCQEVAIFPLTEPPPSLQNPEEEEALEEAV